MTESLKRQLATVMFLATVLVVMCHVDDVMPNKNALVRYLGGIFTDANVANFFFLSGFFLARHYGERNWYGDALAKRMRTLVVPYFAWCVVYLAFYLIVEFLHLGKPHSPGFYNPRRIFGIGLGAPIDFALWYIKTLLYFVIASPPFFWLMKRFRWSAPVLIGAFIALKISPWGNLPCFGFVFHLVGFACFLLGAKVAFSPKFRDFVLNRRNNAILGGVWALSAMGMMAIVSCGNPFHLFRFLHPFYILLSVFCLHRIVAALQWRASDVLVKSSFVIYVSHLLFLKIVSPCMNKIFGGIPTLNYFCMVVLAICFGVGLTVFLRKISPRFLSLLTGGRG